MPEIPLNELYKVMRSQIILSYDNAKETALKHFDDMAGRFLEQLEINEKLKQTAPDIVKIDNLGKE